MGSAHYYLGIYYKNKESFKNAAFHLKRAFDNTSDPDKKVKIEEMLEEIRGKKALSQMHESTKAKKR